MNSTLPRPNHRLSNRAGYTLLTGCTGLLGRYLVRDLLLNGESVCVLARSSRRDRAVDRLETIVSGWERRLGRTLPRPIVLEGNLTSDQLGLNSSDRHWLLQNCRRVVHSAASLKFETDEQGEPERTNIVGTRRLLELLTEGRVADFHFISTAYVAGLRSGTVFESELDVGQQWGNIYEQSKCQAEEMVRSCRQFESLTVYRPSIIVGDSRTGYTTTFHGFYTPLRLAHTIICKMQIAELNEVNFLSLLGLQGNEKKNLIPVDWVSQAIVEIMARPQNYGQTYHLTNPNPVPVAEMYKAFVQELLPLFGRDAKATMSGEMINDQGDWFKNQMRVYEAYWRNDPVFDRTNTDQVLSHCPVPDLGNQVMRMLARYAIDTNFGWPSEPVRQSPGDVRQWCQQFSEGRTLPDEYGTLDLKVSFRVTGSGGLDASFVVRDGAVSDIVTGLADDADVSVYLNSETLENLVASRLTVADAISEGRILILGDDVGTYCSQQILQVLVEFHAAEAVIAG